MLSTEVNKVYYCDRSTLRMAKEDEPIRIEHDDDLSRAISEFHEERDGAALRSGTNENNTLTGTRDKAWEESRYQLPEGMTLLQFLLRRRKKDKPKRGK